MSESDEREDTPPTRTNPGTGETTIASAESLGRYQILSIAGTGGMGRVYAAFDPQLDRRVALKVVHTKDDASHQQRASREAKALARLSHPNVVAIHEVTEHDGQLLIAMEFVKGQTLKGWMSAHPPSGKRQWLLDALDVLLQAGRGLAAAHEAKLVHRDFKPANVLVGDDGRVRVVDFGLARGVLVRGDIEDTRDSDGASSDQITKTGAVVGTPAYMAPEQMRGDPLDGRTDQYGFCVAAWELLYGVRPSLEAGVPDAPQDSAVLDAVEKALRKGLSAAPGSRFGSMERLLEKVQAELEALQGRRPKRRLAVGLVAGVVVLGGVFGTLPLLQQRKLAACRAEADVLAGAWNPSVRESLETNLEGTRVGSVTRVAAKSAGLLDEYAERWRGAFHATCEASIEDNWSEPDADAARWCLGDRRASFEALVAALSGADNDLAVYSVQAATSLDDPAQCADPRLVDAAPPAGSDTGALAAIRTAIAEAEMLTQLENYATAGEKATEAVRAAKDLGWLPLLARARLASARVLDKNGTEEATIAETRRALGLAIRGQTWTVAGAAALLLGLKRGLNGEAETGLMWLEVADALFDISTKDEPTAQADVLGVRSEIQREQGSLDDALSSALAAVSSSERAVGPSHPSSLNARLTLNAAHFERGEHADGIEVLHGAAEAAASSLGDTHPLVADIHGAIGQQYLRWGKPQEARRELEQAARGIELSLGPEHVRAGFHYGHLSAALDYLGEKDESLKFAERSAAVLVKVYGETRRSVGALQILAAAYERHGRIE